MTEKSTIDQDRQRSELLRKQLVQMGEDFEYMKKNKEEWKKQLDAHFQDIERYSPAYTEKSKIVSSISPAKPNAPTIPSLPSNTNSTLRSRRPEMTFRTTLTPSPKIPMPNSIRRTRKLQTSINNWRRKRRIGTASSRRASVIPKKNSTVILL